MGKENEEGQGSGHNTNSCAQKVAFLLPPQPLLHPPSQLRTCQAPGAVEDAVNNETDSAAMEGEKEETRSA